jgi:phage-related protein
MGKEERLHKIFEVDFYRKENGNVPVVDFLYSLTPKLRAKAFRDIELLKDMGNELREPYVKAIKGMALLKRQ